MRKLLVICYAGYGTNTVSSISNLLSRSLQYWPAISGSIAMVNAITALCGEALQTVEIEVHLGIAGSSPVIEGGK